MALYDATDEGALASRLAVPDRVGHRCWALPEGYLPSGSTGPSPQMTSHETICLLNASPRDAEIAIHFADRGPAGPYRARVPARRTLHQRFNDLDDFEPIAKETDFASVIVSDEPIVFRHTRLDSRHAENALLTTIAFPVVQDGGACAAPALRGGCR